MQRCNLKQILATSNRVSFTDGNVAFLKSMIGKQRNKGLDVRFHPDFSASLEDALQKVREGYFVLCCPQIETDFVFVCENGGKGLLGRQKRIFKVFLGDLTADDFSAANSFKAFGIAATSINNIFRHEGFLSGPV